MTRNPDIADKILVALAEPSAFARDGLSMAMRGMPGIELVQAHGSARGLFAALGGHRPDVLISELQTEEGDIMDVLDRVKRDFPFTRVVVGSSDSILSLSKGSEPLLKMLVRWGVAAVFVKGKTSPQELEDLIRTVHRTGFCFPDGLSFAVLDGFYNCALPAFSERELEVLELLCNGASRMEIAEALFISPATVKYHLGNILFKTECKDCLALLQRAYACDWLGFIRIKRGLGV